ncbi:hypothetical protein [Fodinicola acaciae]|uniref:hypothetical protein n=1 Tax=Fodinicola acaciae TaxID=2681555 RepID=UPI0013D30287|nr:hypothetical protein [Fodinicola acaciae]
MTSRRQLFTAAAGGLLVAGCGARTVTTAPMYRWRFVDDLGKTVVSPDRPRKVLCYLNLAAALWDYGVRCAGTYAVTAGDRSTSGNLDRTVTPSFGDSWGELKVEKVLAAGIDLVIVGRMRGAALLTDYDLGAVSAVLPVVNLEMHAHPASRTLARVADLAASLGGRSAQASADAQRPGFHAALTDFTASVRNPATARTAFVAARPHTMDVASPAYPIVALAGESGLPVATLEPAGARYSTSLSWENADRCRADLLLLDRRPYSQRAVQLAANPMWTTLPAVRAHQVGEWNPEPVLSWSGMAAEIRRLAAVVGRARRL